MAVDVGAMQVAARGRYIFMPSVVLTQFQVASVIDERREHS